MTNDAELEVLKTDEDGLYVIPEHLKGTNQAMFAEFMNDTKRRRMEAARYPGYLHLPERYQKDAAACLLRDAIEPLEAANILAGFIPSRPLGMEGHENLDNPVRALRKVVLDCLGDSLQEIARPGLFKDKSYVDSRSLIDWALDKGIELPEMLVDYHQQRNAEIGTRKHQLNAEEDMALKGHSSTLFRILMWARKEVYEEFALGPRPTKVAIVDHIRLNNPEGEISNDAAKAIDKILRPDSRRRGGLFKLEASAP